MAVYGVSKKMELGYVLEEQLNMFVGEFVKRQQKGMENFWVLESAIPEKLNEVIVTNNLDLIIRSMETGPKIAQKYIERPLLYKGRKIDFQFLVLIKKVACHCFNKK